MSCSISRQKISRKIFIPQSNCKHFKIFSLRCSGKLMSLMRSCLLELCHDNALSRSATNDKIMCQYEEKGMITKSKSNFYLTY